MLDLVIRDAEIFDGSGAKPVHGDLGVTGGRIVAVGGKLGAAKETVKADGLALAPGIIDGHKNLSSHACVCRACSPPKPHHNAVAIAIATTIGTKTLLTRSPNR